MLVDTHCHIHEQGYPHPDEACSRAIQANVTTLICVGTSEQSSREAVEFTEKKAYCRAAVGVHPHEVKEGIAYIEQILKDGHDRIVAVGEIGLDYLYEHSPRALQITSLEQQLQWARNYNLPVIFHVREAFDDFWPIFDNFPGIRGELHSFTDSQKNLEKGMTRGLSIGANGISTFTKDDQQRKIFDSIPLDKLLLETDAPFLTPAPHRGKVNEPAFVRVIAEYHAQRRHISLQEIAAATTANATALFAL